MSNTAPMPNDVKVYHNDLSDADRAICDALYKEVSSILTKAENKVWHRHPVWFLDGNPVAGYHKLKDCVRLLFWSGQSFEEPALQPEGTFKAAEARYKTVKDINVKDLRRWLRKSKHIQWDYKNIVKRKGVLERIPIAEKKSKLAEIKTKETNASVDGFINTLPDEQKRKDSYAILEMMEKATGEEPKMWGSSIIGFGNLRYKSPTSGREVNWMRIGFSPRKANLTVYLMDMKQHTAALEKLGKHKLGGGCLYINKLADVDTKVLKGMIDKALKMK